MEEKITVNDLEIRPGKRARILVDGVELKSILDYQLQPGDIPGTETLKITIRVKILERQAQ